jgi:hypothetical protein
MEVEDKVEVDTSAPLSAGVEVEGKTDGESVTDPLNLSLNLRPLALQRFNDFIQFINQGLNF